MRSFDLGKADFFRVSPIHQWLNHIEWRLFNVLLLCQGIIDWTFRGCPRGPFLLHLSEWPEEILRFVCQVPLQLRPMPPSPAVGAPEWKQERNERFDIG